MDFNMCSNRSLSLILSLINQDFVSVGGFFGKGEQAAFFHKVNTTVNEFL